MQNDTQVVLGLLAGLQLTESLFFLLFTFTFKVDKNCWLCVVIYYIYLLLHHCSCIQSCYPKNLLSSRQLHTSLMCSCQSQHAKRGSSNDNKFILFYDYVDGCPYIQYYSKWSKRIRMDYRCTHFPHCCSPFFFLPPK